MPGSNIEKKLKKIKTGPMARWGKELARRTAGHLSAAAATTALAGVLYHGYHKILEPALFKKHFNAMLEFDPELKKYDRAQVEARFRALRKFNPDLSEDPLVASSFVRQTLEMPAVTPAVMQDLSARKTLPSFSKVFWGTYKFIRPPRIEFKSD